MIRGAFITATGTSSGKTFVLRGLTLALRRASRGSHRNLVAIKPIETGADPLPLDALALARACDRPELATAPGLYRHPLPLAPHAAALESGAQPLDHSALASRVFSLAQGADILLVEGAGGLLVPLTATTSIADFAQALGLPLLIVAPDQLGVLSHVLTCVEAAQARKLAIASVVLSARAPDAADRSPRTNRRILEGRLAFPVHSFPFCADDDDALADAAERSGLLALFHDPT